MSTILSIQSHVSYGHVGNSAAVFPLQRMGVEVWPVHTVTFSNHTGYGAWRGPLIEAAQVREVVTGIDERGVLGRVDAVLSGYQGSPDMGAVILEAADRVRHHNPDALYCCDPVMGDVGEGFYCLPGIPEFMRDEVLPRAGIITPNLFELEFLAGAKTSSMADVLAAAAELRSRGPRVVVATSVRIEDASDEVMRMVAVTKEGAWKVETPLISTTFTGSGDMTTAVFLAHLLESGSVAAALGSTASVVYSVLHATAGRDSQELALVQAQDQVVAPAFRFVALQIA